MVLDAIKSVCEYVEGCNVVIDNYVCRLHYKVTAFILMLFSLLLTCRQYFGDPIDCILSRPKFGIDNEALDTYCWIFSTFTVTKHLNGSVGRDIIFPGVGSSQLYEKEVFQQKYYQWTTLVLFFQALLFYVPHFIWLKLEGKRLEQVANELDIPLMDSRWTKKRLNGITDYVTCKNINQQKSYAVKFAFCELLFLVNVVVQLYALNSFFGGQFFCYGRDVMYALFNTDDAATNAVMVRMFPKIAKCSFEYFGPSGTIQNLDALCILPLNIANEKIFAFLFFWFILVASISFIAILYRLSFLDARVRFLMLRYRFEKSLSVEQVNLMMDKFDFGDCFFLCQLSKNMNPCFFAELIEEIAKKFEASAPVVDDDDDDNDIYWIMENSDDGGEYYKKVGANRRCSLRRMFASGKYNLKPFCGKKEKPTVEIA